MKKLLLSVAALALVAFSANAEDKTWNFSTWADGTGYPLGPTVVDGLTINGIESNTNFMAINANNKTIGGVAFTKRAQTNGAGFGTGQDEGIPTQRYVSFNVAGASTVKVWFMSGNTSSTRWAIVSNGTTVVDKASETNQATGTVLEASYTGPAGTLYVYGDAAINIYQISATNVTTGIKDAISSDLLKKVGNELVNPTNLEVTVIGVGGAKVLTSSEASINLSGLAAGQYVAVTAQGSLKFIK